MNTMPKAEPLDRPAPIAWDSDLVEVYRVGYGKLVRVAYLLTGHAARPTRPNWPPTRCGTPSPC